MSRPLGVVHRSQAAAPSLLQLYTRTRSKLNKALHKVTEERSRRQAGGFFFFFFNASGLHCRESPHKRMGSCRQAAVHPSLPFFVRFSPTPPAPRAHTRAETPRQEVQAWIPAGVPNSNQPSGTARGGRSLSSLAHSLSLSGSVGFNQLPPHVLATRAHTQRHTHTHLDDSTHPPPCRPVLKSQKLFGQLTKALCGLTHSRKEGETERRGLMI